MEIEHWAARALAYSLGAAKADAVARVTGNRRQQRVALAHRAMANGFLEVGFNQLAAARRDEGERAAAVRQGEGSSPGEGGEG